MTIMQFDSHHGWYNPQTPLRAFSGYSAPRKPKIEPVKTCVSELSDFELTTLRGGYRVNNCSIDPDKRNNRLAAHNELIRRGEK